MRQTLLRIGRMLFWTVVPMLFVSHNPVEQEALMQSFLDSGYRLKASGDLQKELKGDFNFETNVKTANDGTKFSTLVLRLENDRMDHAVEFLISQKNTNANEFEGTYEISESINGFLNPSNGVFGYADIEAMGELPFFAENGEVNIKKISEDVLTGTLSVTLKNARGAMINLKGSFATQKL